MRLDTHRGKKKYTIRPLKPHLKRGICSKSFKVSNLVSLISDHSLLQLAMSYEKIQIFFNQGLPIILDYISISTRFIMNGQHLSQLSVFMHIPWNTLSVTFFQFLWDPSLWVPIKLQHFFGIVLHSPLHILLMADTTFHSYLHPKLMIIIT